MKTNTAAATADWWLKILQFYELTKPRVVLLIVFTAVVGMFLASSTMVPLDTLIFGTLGIGMSAAAGAAINHIVDRHIDSKMKRTRRRPLASGDLGMEQALIFAVALAAVSMFILVRWVNDLTAVLTFASLIGYALVYTVFLKHWTPQNIVIGGAAGAAPPLLGWTAVTGHVSPDALLLFLIIFCWTPPHFWSLALYRRNDYANAGVPMLPVTHGAAFTRLHILLYTVLLAAVSIMPFATHMAGWLYLAGALFLNARFIVYAARLYSRYSDMLSRRMFVYSIQYLAMLFGIMLIDHYLVLFVNG